MVVQEFKVKFSIFQKEKKNKKERYTYSFPLQLFSDELLVITPHIIYI
jgi:hypothetical protein